MQGAQCHDKLLLLLPLLQARLASAGHLITLRFS
jgi:hypothetical protein